MENQWIGGDNTFNFNLPPPPFPMLRVLERAGLKSRRHAYIRMFFPILTVFDSQGEKIMSFVNKFQIVRDLEY